MMNTGTIFANDIKLERIPVYYIKWKALKYNLLRMGITNTVVTNYDARK